MGLPKVSKVRSPTRILTSALSLMQQTHAPMTTPLIASLQRWKIYFPLTERNQNVEEGVKIPILRDSPRFQPVIR